VSKFLDEHPGGEEVLLDMAGKIATREYDDVGHSDEADKLMLKYLVGSLDPADANKATPSAAASAGKKANAASANGGAASLAQYVVPLLALVACFVAAKYFQIL
jgi:cytochrome b involved in lipid metabolism